MWRNYITLWWRKPTGHFNADDDIRFVTGRYRCGGPWITRRNTYKISTRTGIAFRFGPKHDWKFVGFMRLESTGTTNEKDVAE